jgi:hypothetical protein
MKNKIDNAVNRAWEKWFRPVRHGECAPVSPLFRRGFYEGVDYALKLIRARINAHQRKWK